MSESYTSTTQHIPQANICAFIQDLIPLYLDKEVSPQTYAMIGDHLRQCERCSGYLAGADSVRAQMLRDQQAVQATVATGPTAAQVRQPVVSAVGSTIWRGLMTLTWLGGLMVAFIGAMSGDGTSEALLLSLLMVGVGVAGFLAIGNAYGRWWRLLMVPVWLMGLFLLVHPLLNPFWTPVLTLPVSLVFLVLAAWGLWPHGRQATRPPAHTGVQRAIHKAILSILGAVLCGIGIAAGCMLVVKSLFVGEQLFGIGLATAGAIGLVVLNHWRGWARKYSSRQTTQQLVGFALIGAGALASILILQTALERSLPLLIAGSLIIGGICWLRKPA